jgi:hypothetical protein
MVNFFLPGDTNFDTGLFKNVPLKEGFRIQLRVETYNTFNHSEFNSVNNTATFANANSQGTTKESAIHFHAGRMQFLVMHGVEYMMYLFDFVSARHLFYGRLVRLQGVPEDFKDALDQCCIGSSLTILDSTH